MKLLHVLIRFVLLYDLAYMRKISLGLKKSNKRLVISSHAAFEFAQTKIESFDDLMISSIAATNVRVFPVP